MRPWNHIYEEGKPLPHQRHKADWHPTVQPDHAGWLQMAKVEGSAPRPWQLGRSSSHDDGPGYPGIASSRRTSLTAPPATSHSNEGDAQGQSINNPETDLS